MSYHDQLHRYLFENHAVRGELVTVSETWREIIKAHDYPPPVQQLLGELLVATSLLTATLKFKGEITVQLQGDGPLSLAVINGNHQQEMRGIARIKDDIAVGSSLREMVGKGCLVITIMPSQGERWQGIVDLAGETLAACLEDYFMRSEQLPTRLFIHTRMATENPGAAGVLLQVLPDRDTSHDDFGHLATLTDTLKTAELLDLPARDVLWRLYHQEEVMVYDPQPVSFHCTCSHERCSEVLKTLPVAEVDEMLIEDGRIDMHCDYCGSHYVFDAVDIAALSKVAIGSDSRMH